MRRMWIVMSVVLGACSAARPFEDLPDAEREGLELLDIAPAVQRHENDCGPAALSEVMAYWGEPVELPAADRPSLAGELKEAAKERGLAAFLFEGTWEDVTEQLGKRRPLIVAIKPERRIGFVKLPEGEVAHMVVLVGVNGEREYVVFDDPDEGRMWMERADFERQWEQTKELTLLVGKAE